MVELIRGLRADRVRENLERVHDEIAAAGRADDGVQILAAVKYLDPEELPVLAEAGITLVGENRAQELERKAAAYPGMFSWDFIGRLQSRKVRTLLPLVRVIHSVATDSALDQLGRYGHPDTEVLVEVNLSGEASKGGIRPEALDDFIARCPVRVVGLMTMPPLAGRPEDSRPYFATLHELAATRGLRELSMGTTQDYPAALREGATIIRLGSTLFH